MPDFLTVQGPTPNSYAPPRVDSSWVGNLWDDYAKGQQYGRLRQLQTMFQPGTPGAAALQQAGIAPGSLYGLLAAAGGAETVAPFAQQAQKAQIYQQLMGRGGQLGGVGQPQTSAAQPTGGSDPRGLVPTIIDAAKRENIDPNRFLAMNRGEGLANYNGDYENGKPTSFGSVQLHRAPDGKALGDEYFKETGKDPSDPANEKDMIYWAAHKLHETGWSPWMSTRAWGWGKWDGIGDRPGADSRTALTAANPAAASPGPGAPSPGTQPTGPTPGTAAAESPQTAPVGAAPIVPRETSGQPPTSASLPPFMGGTNPANPQSPTPPQQTAQAASPAPAQAIPQGRYTEAAAQNLEARAAAIRENVRKEGLASAGSGLAIPAESFKGELDQAAEFDRQAAEIRKELESQREKQFGVGIAGQTAGAGEVGKAQGARVAEAINAGGKPANDKMNALNVIEDAVRQGGDNVKYGPGAEAWNKAKTAIAGMPVIGQFIDKDALAAADTIQKMNAVLAAAAAKGMTARPSQLEFKTFVANNPGLLNSKEGTLALIKILREETQQDIGLSQIAGRMRPEEFAGWGDRQQRYYEENPIHSPFTSKPLTPPRAPATINSKEALTQWGTQMGLAPGDQYITPDGKPKHFAPLQAGTP